MRVGTSQATLQMSLSIVSSLSLKVEIDFFTSHDATVAWLDSAIEPMADYVSFGWDLLEGVVEIWLTSEDTVAYGHDIGKESSSFQVDSILI